MSIRTRTTYYDEADGMEYETDFNPTGDPLIKRVGDRLVVAYLVQDSDCGVVRGVDLHP